MTIGKMNELLNDMEELHKEFTIEINNAKFRDGQAWKSCDIAQSVLEKTVATFWDLSNFLKTLNIDPD